MCLQEIRFPPPSIRERGHPQGVWADSGSVNLLKKRMSSSWTCAWGQDSLWSTRGKERWGEPTLSLTHSFKIGLYFSLGRKTFPSGMNLQLWRSRTGRGFATAFLGQNQKEKPSSSALSTMGSGPGTRFSIVNEGWAFVAFKQLRSSAWGHGPAPRPGRRTAVTRDSRGDRREQAQDRAGSAELWAMLATNPFGEATLNFSLVCLSVQCGDGPAPLASNQILLGRLRWWGGR